MKTLRHIAGWLLMGAGMFILAFVATGAWTIYLPAEEFDPTPVLIPAVSIVANDPKDVDLEDGQYMMVDGELVKGPLPSTPPVDVPDYDSMITIPVDVPEVEDESPCPFGVGCDVVWSMIVLTSSPEQQDYFCKTHMDIEEGSRRYMYPRAAETLEEYFSRMKTPEAESDDELTTAPAVYVEAQDEIPIVTGGVSSHFFLDETPTPTPAPFRLNFYEDVPVEIILRDADGNITGGFRIEISRLGE